MKTIKILTWILIVFAGIGTFGIMLETNPDSSSVMGIILAALIIVQGVMVLIHLNKE